MDGSRVNSCWHDVLPDLRSTCVVSEQLWQCIEALLTSTAMLPSQHDPIWSLPSFMSDVAGLDIVILGLL